MTCESFKSNGFVDDELVVLALVDGGVDFVTSLEVVDVVDGIFDCVFEGDEDDEDFKDAGFAGTRKIT
jgi:hypothetical protein